MANYYDQVRAQLAQAEAAGVALPPMPAPFTGPAEAAQPALQAAAPVTATQTTGSQRQPRKDAEVYVNMGLPMEVTDPTTGEVRSELVNIPFGLDLCNMPDSDLKGLGPTIAALRLLGNMLRDQLIAFGKTNVAPGEAVVLPGAVVTLRHAGKKVAEVPVDRKANFESAMGSLFSGAIPLNPKPATQG